MLWFCALWYRLENAKLFVQFLRYLHDRCHVVASVTVIWRWPNCHQVLWRKPKLESFLNQLMCSCNQLNPVNVIEVSDHFCAENPSCSSVVRSPGFDVLGIWPHEVAKSSWNKKKSYLRVGFPFFYRWFSSGQLSWFQEKDRHECREFYFRLELPMEGNQKFNWSTSMGSSIRTFS